MTCGCTDTPGCISRHSSTLIANGHCLTASTQATWLTLGRMKEATRAWSHWGKVVLVSRAWPSIEEVGMRSQWAWPLALQNLHSWGKTLEQRSYFSVQGWCCHTFSPLCRMPFLLHYLIDSYSSFKYHLMFYFLPPRSILNSLRLCYVFILN